MEMFTDLAKTFEQFGGSNVKGIQELIYDNSYFEYGAYFLLVIILIFICVYIYYEYVDKKPKFSSSNEFINTDDMTDADKNNPILYYFYADWCPHCQKLKTNGVHNHILKLDGTTYGNNDEITLSVKELQCDDKNSSDGELNEAQTYMKEYNVDGFPTVLLEFNGEIFEFEAKIDKKNINSFIDTVFKS
tara:strand:+ start:1182 stop:1748 length:567 start_codon:yes stop_codon:yes gene_type:complete